MEKTKTTKWINTMRTILNIIFIFLLVTSCSTKDTNKQYTIRHGDFSASLVESGELQAVNNNIIVVPGINWRYAQQIKLTSLAEHGTRVKKGEIIAEIDRSSIMKTLFDMQSKLEVEQTSLDKLRIQQSTREEEIKTDILAQEATYSLAKLQLEKFKFETVKRQQIKKLEFERATIALQKVKDQKKTNNITSKKSILIQSIKIRQIQNNIQDINRNLAYFTIKSPVDGMVQIRRNYETNVPLKVGDRVWPGYPIASVPDLTKMKVLAKINETDIGKLKLNQKSIVRLQAYPDAAFEGKITKIQPICYIPEKDSKIKVFDFEVLINKSEDLLKPGMSVGCEVFFAEYKKVSFIENECIIRSDSATYIVLEKDRKHCPVKLGPSNNQFTMIYGKFKKGEKAIPVNIIQTSFNQ